MEDTILYRMEANRAIASSYIQLTNFFLRDERKECASLEVLWSSAGKLICKLLQVQDAEFKSSNEFYEILERKLRLINVSLASDLNATDAANGDNLEICKFYAMFLEYLRKEQGDVLKNILEKLTDTRGFDCLAIVKTFTFFDTLYANDCADDWWSILAEKISEVSGFSTPVPRRLNSSMFTTPTTSSRKIRSVVSTARRSPIVDAIDSPTMKYLRCDRELKEMKKRMADYEIKLDGAETENSSLLAENRELKQKLVDVRSNFSAERGTIQSLEEKAVKLKEELDSKILQVENLNRSLEEARQSMRSLLRRVEEDEAEKRIVDEKNVSLEAAKSSLMKQLMDLRETNEAEYVKWQASSSEMSANLKTTRAANEELSIELTMLRSSEKAANVEIERLNSMINSIDGANVQLKDKNYQLEEELEKARKELDESIQKEKHNREVIIAQRDSLLSVANKTIDRINAELEMEKAERHSLKDALDSLRQITGQKNVSDAESTETLTSIRSSFTIAQSKIETLEVEVQSKERMITALKSQLEQQEELIADDRSLQERLAEQFKKEKEKLTMDLAESKRENQQIMEESSKKLKELENENLDIASKLVVSQSTQREMNDLANRNAQLETEKSEIEEELRELRKRLHHSEKHSIILDNYDYDDIKEMLMNAPNYSADMFGIKPRPTITSGFEFHTPCQSARVSLAGDTNSLNTSRLLGSSSLRDSIRSYNSQKIPSLDEESLENVPRTDESTKKKNRRSIASYVFKKKN